MGAVIERHRIARLAAMISTAALVGCGDDGPPADATSVVLITIDTLRADRLGCYGHDAAATPNIDALASRGARFADARTCVPVTLPAHATILTGTYPPYHGIRDNGVASLGDEARSLAEPFQEAGWATAAFVSAVVLDRRYGLDQGFDVYDGVPNRKLLTGGLLEERRAERTVDACLEWLAQVGDDPFFVWLHLFDPHTPYDPPPRFAARFRESLYDGEIAYVDEQLGRVFDALDHRSAERTLVVLTADHGESLWEHGEETHGIFVYDSCLRVPLIVAGGGAPAGAVIETPVATVDVAGTIAEAVGLESLPASQGESLVPLLGDGTIPERPIYFENYGGYIGNRWSPLVGVTNGRRKVIDAPAPELYDLVADPGETDNLYLDEPDVAKRLSAASQEMWRSITNRAPPPAVARSMSASERQTLEQLGYAVGEAPTGPLPYPTAELADPKDRIASHAALNRGIGLIAQYQRDPSRHAANVDLAIEVLDDALEADPDGGMLHEYAGIARLLKGDHDAAIHHLRAAVSRRPERVSARHNLALAFRAARRIDEAVDQLTRAVEIDATFVQGWMTLGEVEEARGDLRAAARCWERFLEHWGADDEAARSARSRLLRLRDRIGE